MCCGALPTFLKQEQHYHQQQEQRPQQQHQHCHHHHQQSSHSCHFAQVEAIGFASSRERLMDLLLSKSTNRWLMDLRHSALSKMPERQHWLIDATTGERRCKLAESDYLRMLHSGINPAEVWILTLCGCGNCEHCRECDAIRRLREERDAALIKQRAQPSPNGADARAGRDTKGNAYSAADLLPENFMKCTCGNCAHCRKYAEITGSDECRH